MCRREKKKYKVGKCMKKKLHLIELVKYGLAIRREYYKQKLKLIPKQLRSKQPSKQPHRVCVKNNFQKKKKSCEK